MLPKVLAVSTDIYQWFLMGELARAQDSEWKRQELLDAIPGAGPFWVFRSTIRRLGRKQRSEEHTSELQSRLHLVCRLLLEKKIVLITGSIRPSDGTRATRPID